MIITKCKRIVFMALLWLISSKGFSQLVLQNSLSVPIEVCVGWHQDVGDWIGYETKGWYTIYPGQSIAPGLNFTSRDDVFYLYARTATGAFKEVTNGVKLLVHPKDPFDVKNADMEYVKTQNQVYEWRSFKRKDVHFSKDNNGFTLSQLQFQK